MSATVPTFDNSTQAIVWMLDKLESEGGGASTTSVSPSLMILVRWPRMTSRPRRECCGAADFEVIVNGRPAMVGCNYGH